MRPKTRRRIFFRARFDQIIHMKHRLGPARGKLDWGWLGEIAPLYSEEGRPDSRRASKMG